MTDFLKMVGGRFAADCRRLLGENRVRFIGCSNYGRVTAKKGHPRRTRKLIGRERDGRVLVLSGRTF